MWTQSVLEVSSGREKNSIWMSEIEIRCIFVKAEETWFIFNFFLPFFEKLVSGYSLVLSSVSYWLRPNFVCISTHRDYSFALIARCCQISLFPHGVPSWICHHEGKHTMRWKEVNKAEIVALPVLVCAVLISDPLTPSIRSQQMSVDYGKFRFHGR